jgi:hypothetical protein
LDEEEEAARPVPQKTKRSKTNNNKFMEEDKKMQVDDHAHAEALVQRQIDAGKELRDTLTAYLQFKMR